MPVEVQKEELDACHVALTIGVPPESIRKAMESVFNQFAKRTNVPGFRPGKAPRHLMKRFIDESRVQELAVERALGDAFREAVKQAGVEPYSEVEPQVELPEEEVDPEKGFSFKATVTLQPQVRLGDLEALSARRVVMAIGDEEVDRELGRLAEQAAAFQPVDDPAQVGDRVRATAEVSIDGEPVPDLSFPEPTLFEIGANLEEFDAGLRDLRAGEEKTFAFTFPEDLEDENLQGKQASARVSATEVLRRTAPEITEEFARLAGFESLEAMRARFREGLERQANALADQEMNEGLLQEVVRRSTVHFPQEMVEREVSSRLSNLLSALQKRSLTLDDYLAAEKKDLAQLQAELGEEAREALTHTLVLLEVARQNEIRVADAEVEQEVKRRAEAEDVKPSQLRRALNESGEIDVLRNRVFRRKVADFLRGKAEIREVAA
jgi:trigger factor